MQFLDYFIYFKLPLLLLRGQNINYTFHHHDHNNTTSQKWSFVRLTKEKMGQNLLYWLWKKCAIAFKYRNRIIKYQYLQSKIFFFLVRKQIALIENIIV